MAPRYRILVSILFLGLLSYLLSRLDLDSVYNNIVKSNKIFLTLGVMFFISGVQIKILKFSLISRYYSYPLSFKQAALIEMVGISFATLTPGRIGEGSKAILMNKHLKMPMSTSFSIIVLERLIDILILSGGAFLLTFYLAKNMVLLTSVLFLVLVIALILFLRFSSVFIRIVPERFRKFFDVKIKNDRARLILIFAAALVAWAFEAGFQFLVLLSFDVHIPFYIVFGIVCIGTIAVIFSFMPAGIGTVELSYLSLYPLAGVPMEVAASVLLIYRFFSVLLPFLFAVLILNYYKLSISEVKREMGR